MKFGRGSIAVVYASALLQGLTVVSFPASGTLLKHSYGLTDAGYGSLFLPQMAFTILGSVLGGLLAGRIGLGRLLVAATVMAALSQAALFSVTIVEPGHVLPVLLLGTALMGTGFGLSAAPLNTLPGLLFPKRGEQALVALHTVLGVGFAVGPIGVSALVAMEQWGTLPIIIGVSCSIAALFTQRASLPNQVSATTADSSSSEPPLFWLGLLGLVAVLYAFAEGTFSNWAAIYLHEERGVGEETSAIAISAFWIGLAGGRLLVSALVARVSSIVVWLTLPVLMALVFFALPFASGPTSGIALFIAAGLATSAFFPLTVAFANSRYPNRAAMVSSLLTAALMVGVGTGSFAIGALRASLGFDALYRVSMGYPLGALAIAIVVVVGLRRNNSTCATPRRG